MRKKLRVCAHLLKKSLMVNFIFSAVKHVYHLSHSYPDSFEGLNLKNRQVQYFLLTQYTPSIKKWYTQVVFITLVEALQIVAKKSLQRCSFCLIDVASD